MLQQDRPIQLLPGQGLAAVVMNAPARITQISFVGKSPGTERFEVPDTQGGWTLYLVPVQAGRYCLQHFRYGRVIFNSREDLGCFTALPGHITYAGDIAPSIEPDGAVTDQQFNPIAFSNELHIQYPVLAAAYPVAAPAPAPAEVGDVDATGRTSAWTQEVPGSRSQAIYVRNNTSWSIKLTALSLSDCENVKEPCTRAPLDVVLEPFAIERVFTVDAADPNSALSYRYGFTYRNAD
ncbi:MAG TPA: hypothetical protein VGT99_11155 [Gammaproteobacteria bacterium]|nr:hypothetical protein [Gammaproteobacteria bacterium]